MKIEVKQEHINDGQRGSCRRCPIALAIKEAVGHDSVIVDGNAIVGSGDYDLPQKAVDFIFDFDRSGRAVVSPFTFDLPIEEVEQ